MRIDRRVGSREDGVKGNSGMGMRKHGRSGRSGKSPKLRLAMRREAEKDEHRPKKYPMVGSIGELLRKL